MSHPCAAQKRPTKHSMMDTAQRRAGLGIRELCWMLSFLCVSRRFGIVVKGLVPNEARDAQVRAGKGTGVSGSVPAEGWG